VLEPGRVMAWKDHALGLISYAARGTLIVMLHLRSHCGVTNYSNLLGCYAVLSGKCLLTWIAVFSFSGLSSPRKLLDPKYALFTQLHSVTSENTCISISYSVDGCYSVH
jgi:hypothetical protein